MKFARFLIVALPLLFLGATFATPRHQAYGQLRFGMPAPQAATVMTSITHSKMVLMADARRNFVTSGVLRVARDPAFEQACRVSVAYQAEPFVNRVTVASGGQPADRYDSYVQSVWDNFQDLADAKFRRVGEKGTFPGIEKLGSETKEVVTDTWEMEGIRIELMVVYRDPIPQLVNPGPPTYWSVLRATEIAPPK